ncbi:hypothetical protein [Pusillimonas sp. ANT_WB101]|uniref:hypothetical protein n=1 Tax=Pusillimonas sp. ANT_WB101 TaxID=2597356 RepID=UPI0011EF9F1F|nr:hypothetical protein [Pusillimonas sp. ANT_WB101]KAA0893074.1 hypothetical protein FQ179_12550 [Pusillimonas sp. ANT_WB101]
MTRSNLILFDPLLPGPEMPDGVDADYWASAAIQENPQRRRSVFHLLIVELNLALVAVIYFKGMICKQES